MEPLRIHRPLPQRQPVDIMLAQLIHHLRRRAQIQIRPQMPRPHQLPRRTLEESQLVVVQIRRQIRVIRNHNRDMQHLAVVNSADPQQRRLEQDETHPAEIAPDASASTPAAPPLSAPDKTGRESTAGSPPPPQTTPPARRSAQTPSPHRRAPAASPPSSSPW